MKGSAPTSNTRRPSATEQSPRPPEARPASSECLAVQTGRRLPRWVQVRRWGDACGRGGWCRDGKGSGGRRRDRRRCRRHWLGIRLRRPVDEPERVSWHCWSSTTGGLPTSTWTLNGPGEVWGLGSSTSQRNSTPTASICRPSKATSELGTSMSGMGSRRWRRTANEEGAPDVHYHWHSR
jgi:hypothetical protein